MKTRKQQHLKQLAFIGLVLFIINFISYFVFHRFDLTNDQRYTLSETTKKIIEQVKSPVIIDVFLEGELPLQYKKLQNETKQLLEEFTATNSNVTFQFINPFEKEEERVENMKLFYKKEMPPVEITVNQRGQQIQLIALPWAMANYNDKTAKVQLLKNKMGETNEQKIESSVQYLEYAFAEALNKITKEKQSKIAIINGNGELEDQYIANFLKTVFESYKIGKVTLDSVAKNPVATQEILNKFDLAIIAKPREKFSEQEKLVLDQFIMKGGKTLWMVDGVKLDMEDLSETGEAIAAANDLNLTDLFFKYGIRINPLLIKDEWGTPIKLASGNTNNPEEMQNFVWKYAPFIYPSSKNSITKNTEGIKLEFCSPIEILSGSTKKTILLESSRDSKTVGVPNLISLASVTEESNKNEYTNGGFLTTAVLLEGSFTSTYKNRVLPFKTNNFLTESKKTQMIVISDGDIIKNQLEKGEPLELGYDKWTKTNYGNKEFLLNCVNYLLDDTGLINIRSKEVRLPVLNTNQVEKEYTKAQIVTVVLPLILLGIFGFCFSFLRKRKYNA